jgi:hypothetical protein
MKHLLLTTIAAMLLVGCASTKDYKVNITQGKENYKPRPLKKEKTESHETPELLFDRLEAKERKLLGPRKGLRKFFSPIGVAIEILKENAIKRAQKGLLP